MLIRRSPLVLATVVLGLVGILSTAPSATPLSAQAPPPTTTVPLVPDEDPFGIDTLPPASDVLDPVEAGREEIVHSWALTPAGADVSSGADNRPNLSYTADPGTVIEDAVTLYNLGNEQLTFRVYATDAFNNSAGEFDLLRGDELPTDVGSWVTFAQQNITVPPQQSATIPITITVPADATPGDHTGGILASSEALSTGPSGETVVLDRRTGSRLFLRVNGALRPELAIANVETSYEPAFNPFGGRQRVAFRIENRGNVRLDGTHTVSASGPFGLGRQSTSPVDFPELLPGQGIDVVSFVEDVPALFLSTATIEVEPAESGDGALLDTSRRSARAFAPPITVLLVLLAAVAFLLVRRQYRRRQADAGAVLVVDTAVLGELEREHQPT